MSNAINGVTGNNGYYAEGSWGRWYTGIYDTAADLVAAIGRRNDATLYVDNGDGTSQRIFRDGMPYGNLIATPAYIPPRYDYFGSTGPRTMNHFTR